jgi:hypothetical protein
LHAPPDLLILNSKQILFQEGKTPEGGPVEEIHPVIVWFELKERHWQGASRTETKM